MIFTTKLRKKQINMPLYHKEKLGQWITTGKTQIQAYIGILIYMGLVDLPEIEDYFQGDFYICPIVRQAMALKRFKKLQQYLQIIPTLQRMETGR